MARNGLAALVLCSALSGGCFFDSNFGDPNSDVPSHSTPATPSTPSTPSTPNTNGSSGSTRTVTLYATDDSDVSSLDLTRNFGYRPIIRTGIVDFGSSGLDRYTGFVKFSFSNIPENAAIIDAELILTTAFNNTRTKPKGNVTLSSVTDTDWSESGINWVNSPSTANYISSRDVEFDVQGTVEFNVGSVVSGWINNPSTNDGFMLQTRFGNVTQSYAAFYSRNLNKDVGPRLVVTYKN